MRSVIVVLILFLTATYAEAGRRAASPCDGGACAVQQSADVDVAMAAKERGKAGWPWTPVPAPSPTPAPTPSPAPAPVVVPVEPLAVEVAESPGVLTATVAAVVRAPAKLIKAIRERERRPLLRVAKGVRLICHRRR